MLKNAANFWLNVAMALFILSLLATAVAYISYAHAEHVYQTQLSNVVFKPGNSIDKTLSQYAAGANEKLRLQIIFGVVTLAATVNVLTQVVRTRNQRLTTQAITDTSDLKE